MMKKRKFGTGGMPSIEESIKSGNRVSRQVGEETKRMMPPKKRTMPSLGESVKSGNRMSRENAKDLKDVKKYAKGGKVRRYADGDLVMGGAASDISGLNLGMPSIDTDLRRALTDKELMDANLAAVRAREAADMMKAKPKPKPEAAKPKPKPKPKPDEDNKPPASKPPASKPPASKPPANKPPGMRVGSESARAAKTGMREGLRRGANALGDFIKSPFRAAANPGRDYAKGGSVTRGDGCAIKGKTKGKMR
jgi:hypothetical protein